MPYTINSGYGNLQAQTLTGTTTGKTFLVSKSTQPNADVLGQMFVPDSDGVPRLFSTITAALAQCVADRGDVIYVAPGYTETITAAAGIVVSIAGVSIIGLGTGTLRPTISFTTAITASLNISASNVLIKNMVFTAGFDAITAMINVTGAYVAFEDCEVTTNTAAAGAVLGILTAATATGLRVERCRFLGAATNSGTTTTAQIQHEVGVDYIIKDCYFTGKMTQAILNATTCLRGLIANNFFVVATGTKGIAMAAASTPFITNNRFNVASGTTPIVAAAGFVAGNIYSAAAGVTSTGQTGSTATVSTI